MSAIEKPMPPTHTDRFCHLLGSLSEPKTKFKPCMFLDVQNATNLWRAKWSQLLATLSIRNASRARGERELDFCAEYFSLNMIVHIFSHSIYWYFNQTFTYIVSRCKNPFPTGERVTFTGKNCLCQKCIQAEKSVDMRLQKVSLMNIS